MNIDIVSAVNQVQGRSRLLPTMQSARAAAEFAAVLTALTMDTRATLPTSVPASVPTAAPAGFPLGAATGFGAGFASTAPTAAAPTADVGAAPPTGGSDIDDAAPAGAGRGCLCAGH